ncbi:MAG: hypothetical protein RL112_2933, partial [Planctomycetota bacterium]
MRMNLLAVLTALVLSTTAVDASNAQAGRGQPTSSQDILATAKGAGFNTLVAAAEAAGMVDVLKGAGPLTVFAP